MEKLNKKENMSKRSERIQIIFLILLVVAIVSLISAVVVVVKNVEMFTANPIALGIDQYEFDKCMCMQGNKIVEVNKNGFVTPDPILSFKLGK